MIRKHVNERKKRLKREERVKEQIMVDFAVAAVFSVYFFAILATYSWGPWCTHALTHRRVSPL